MLYKEVGAHRVEDEDAGFALRGDEEAEECFVALTVMVQVDVSHAACSANGNKTLLTTCSSKTE